jgi:N-glycosylase/DNA lyase
MPLYHFPDEARAAFEALRPTIQARLEEFARVPRSEYFYELCFCLCTPQSKAEHAAAVIAKLKSQNFQQYGNDPTAVLRNQQHYIRFHHTKAARLLAMREQWDDIMSIIDASAYCCSSEEKRDWLVEHVNGLSYKEASHFLRNIGYRNLPILDRHILKHLVRWGVFDAIPSIAGRKRYLAVGQEFRRFADTIEIPMDELDLFFWASETGIVLK